MRAESFGITIGVIAYFFLVVMLITSFNRFSQLISISLWSIIHTIGGYWILIVFSNSMVGRVLGGKIGYLPFAILVLSVWLIRLLSWKKRRAIKTKSEV